MKKKHKILSLLAGILIIGTLGWGFRGSIMTFLAHYLLVSEPPQAADIIIVVTGANLPERLKTAAYYFHEKFAPSILLSGNMSLQKETGTDLMKQYMLQLGVPESAILREPKSRTTRENAALAKPILMSHHINSAILVTSAFHTRRARATFEKCIPEISITTIGASTALPKDWWIDPELFREMSYEYLNLILELFRKPNRCSV